MMQATPDPSRKPYRPPEMAGTPHLARRSSQDDVMRQPEIVAALLLAVVIIVGLGFVHLGTTYGDQRLFQTDRTAAARAQSPAVD